MSELAGQGGENGLKVALITEIPRTEKAPPKCPVREAHLRERLGDSRLSGLFSFPSCILVCSRRDVQRLQHDTSP